MVDQKVNMVSNVSTRNMLLDMLPTLLLLL